MDRRTTKGQGPVIQSFGDVATFYLELGCWHPESCGAGVSLDWALGIESLFIPKCFVLGNRLG